MKRCSKTAQLVELYLDVWQLTGDEDFRKIEGIADYVLANLYWSGGGFCAQMLKAKARRWRVSAGCRRAREGPDKDEVAETILGVTAGGNFVDHSIPNLFRIRMSFTFRNHGPTSTKTRKRSLRGSSPNFQR